MGSPSAHGAIVRATFRDGRAMAAAIIGRTGKIILLMRSYGKREDAIARRLKMTAEMIEEEFFVTALKLPARTPVHAVATALRTRLVPLRPRVKRLGIKVPMRPGDHAVITRTEGRRSRGRRLCR
jgi:hypothetical protein